MICSVVVVFHCAAGIRHLEWVEMRKADGLRAERTVEAGYVAGEYCAEGGSGMAAPLAPA